MKRNLFLLVVAGLTSFGAFAATESEEALIRDVGACVRYEGGRRIDCREGSRRYCNAAYEELLFGNKLRGLTSFYFYPGDHCARN